MTKQENWEKEFDEMFKDIKDSSYWWRTVAKTKSFIRSTRQELLEEVLGIVEGMTVADYKNDSSRPFGINTRDRMLTYNGALSDLKSKILKLK